MTPSQSLEELAGRVGEATGPNRFLDAHIRLTLEPPDDDDFVTDCPAYTASIDVALGLVERMLPGAGVALYWSAEGASAGVSYGPKFIEYWNTIGKRPAPIAILSALLRAISSHPGTPE